MPTSIPLYRLVHFQVERTAPEAAKLPEPLQKGAKVLSAIYRVGPYRSSTGTPNGYAIRLLVDPTTTGSARPQPRVAATAGVPV